MARNRRVVDEGFVGGGRGMLEDRCNCQDLESSQTHSWWH